jgi:hypothetical protein
MVVAGRLDPDPDQPNRPAGADLVDPIHQLGHPSLGHSELERPYQQLPGNVAGKRHRGVLADIDRDSHQLLRRQPTGLLDQPLHPHAVDVHHEHTTSSRCEES